MKISEIQELIRGKAIDVSDRPGERVADAEFIRNYEVMDRREGGIRYLHPDTIKIFDGARRALGRPLRITSGYRTARTQEMLIAKWGKATHSPHTMGYALDIDTDNMTQAKELRHALYAAADYLGHRPRIGINKYNGNFVHFDVVFLLFTDYGGEFPYPEDYESAKINWRPGVTW